MTSSDSSRARVEGLDGLRGIAALVVVFTHLQTALGWDKWLPGLFNGYLAVDIFFILSGYVLALSLRRKMYAIDGKIDDKFNFLGFASQRFIRLYLPFLVAIFVSLLIRYLILEPSTCNELLLTSQAYCTRWLDPFSSGNFFYQLLKITTPNLNAPTWTLPVELINSLFIPACMLIYALSPNYLYFMIAMSLSGFIFISILPSYFYLFALGVILFFSHKSLKFLEDRKISSIVLIATYLSLLGPVSLQGSLPILVAPAAISCIQLAVNDSAWKSFLSRKIFIKIGNLSFALYLLHWPVFLGILPQLASFLNGRLEFSILTAKLISSVISLLLVYTLSILFYLYVDKPSIFLGRFIRDKISVIGAI